MGPESDGKRRRLIVWWSAGGLTFLAVVSLLFWAGYRSGQPPVVEEPPGLPASLPAAGQNPAEDIQAGDQDPTNPSGAEPQTEPANPEETIQIQDPKDSSNQPALQPPDENLPLNLPQNWDQLTSPEKIALNPSGCDLLVEDIDLEDGSCRRRSTLSSKSTPWNPMALNFISTTEVESRALKIDCYDRDLSQLLNTPSRPGATNWGNLIADSSLVFSNSRFRHCVLRVALEMTVDNFYFPNGCRTWSPGFVKLVVGSGDEQETYGSLSAPGPGTVCTKVIVPIDKGQQIEQVFLFKIPGSEMLSEVTRIKFDALDPRLEFSGDFGFIAKSAPADVGPAWNL